MIALETARTILRPLTADDYSSIYSCASDENIVKHMIWGPFDSAETVRYLKQCEEDWAAEPMMNFEFGIILKETGALAGACWIHLEGNRRCGELGWVLHSDYWNQGLMSEAAGALLRFGFEDLKLHRLSAYCFADNQGSYKIMEKYKMRREGHYIKSDLRRFTEGETWVDIYQYAILDEEYLQNRI